MITKESQEAINRQVLEQLERMNLPTPTDWLSYRSKGLQYLLVTGNIRGSTQKAIKEAQKISVLSKGMCPKFTEFWDRHCVELIGYRPDYQNPPSVHVEFTEDGHLCQYTISVWYILKTLKSWKVKVDPRILAILQRTVLP